MDINNFKKLSLRTRLIFTMIAVSLVPTTLISFYSLHQAQKELKNDSIEKLEAVREIKAQAVERYFTSIKGQISILSQNEMIIKSMKDFSQAFEELNNKYSKKDVLRRKKELRDYYINDFQNEYKRTNNRELDVEKILDQLDDQSIILQHYYIQNNPNPLGKKDLLSAVKGNERYFDLHAKGHPFLRNYLNEFEYYDIFLVDSKTGHIVYSVFKEIDFATSLLNGPFSQTNFADAFRQANKLKTSGDFVIVDYKGYTPSYEAPASFIASPIFDKGKKIGVLVFQMPIERLNKIMGERTGMGKTGETYLVGEDYLMRSDSLDRKNIFSTVNSFRNPKVGQMKTNTVINALKGNSGSMIEVDYDNKSTLKSYTKINILDKFNWALISKIDADEAFIAVKSLQYTIVFALLSLILFMSFIGVYLSNSISSPVLNISKFVESETEKLNEISVQINDSSSELAKTSEEQATAIKQTITNILQFSDMLSNTSKQLEKGLELVQAGEATATIGIDSIKKMLESMNDIQVSNKRLQSIVKAISRVQKETLVIDEIVSETRLLSFNASIEAARAGEHGKGFSLIAEEVGKLAKISGNASFEIKKILNDSTKEVGDVVKKTKSSVDDGRLISKECENVFLETTEYLKKIVESVKHINSVAKDQELGIKQTSDYMYKMNNIIDFNRKNAENLKNQADNLNVNQKKLLDIINNLKSVIEGKAS
ncbi:MAG: methyl-accepting chemotaxis protein [Bacteriovoracaceae bacterium]